ncbi:UNVERIFIED_CONTAM: hypothetical protein PYX00_001312 [Menopon gallinae]
MMTYTKSLNKMARDVKLLRTVDYEAEVPKDGKKYRHQRVLRQQVAELERESRDLRTGQSRLEKEMRKLEKRGRSEHPSNEVIDERLAERVVRLEEAGRSTLKQMFNVTSQVSELNRLHMSMLQLLESVESLENKMDKNIPELQREISKLEFNMAQTSSTLSIIKQEQTSHRSTLKSLESTVSGMGERVDIDHGHITSLQAQFLNATLRNWCRNETVEIRRENVQDSRIAALEERLETHIEEEEDMLPATTAFPESVREETLFNRSTLPELIYSLRELQQEYVNLVHQLPRDCGSVDGKSGIYAIAPGEGAPLLVSCDMTTAEGGWTVVQRRIDGSQDFNRVWKEYAEGFGDPSGELWLGNEALHRLTSDNCSSLRVEIADIYGKKWLAEYEGFYISDAADGYRIHVSGYSGNASDALDYQNNMQFSAVDSDRDISNTHCAQNYKGGWWFSHCQHANLNGRYNLGLTWFDGTRNEWIAVAFSEMKVRRRKNCPT